MELASCSSEKITDLAKAMLEAQRAMSPVTKNADNPFTKSRYATLTQVMETCRKALFDNGLWVTQYTVPAESGFISLITKIFHIESEQWQSSLLTMPAPKNDPQAYGSALTYMRRYGLSVIVGIVCEDDDDDANSASGKTGDANGARKTQPAGGKTPARQQNGKPPATTPAPKAPEPSAPPAQNPSVQNPAVPEHVQKIVTSLPRLDGVAYSTVMGRDGKFCITASGNTDSRKEMLKGAGFQWNGERRLWWRYAEAA